MLDNLIFGDNQFFGVSHMSEDRGIERMRRFQKNEEIIKVIDMAYEAGIQAFSFSTHDRVAQICDHFRSHPKHYADLRLYPALPYAQKYAHLVNEKGVFGAVSDVLFSNNRINQIINTLTRGGKALFTQDPAEVMKLMVDAELKMFRGLDMKVIFLQNIVTDLLLGFGIPEFFIEFARHIRENYNAEPGFITLNMPRLVDFLIRSGIQNPIVCSAINKAGFQMNPNREAYEKALAEKPFQPMAMSVLAAGALKPQEAFEYIGSLKRIQSIMFGASTQSNILQTKKLAEQYCNLHKAYDAAKS
jgi:hypothetical protein